MFFTLFVRVLDTIHPRIGMNEIEGVKDEESIQNIFLFFNVLRQMVSTFRFGGTEILTG